MSLKDRGINESFPTFPARIGLLSRVSPHVLSETGELNEDFSTLLTLIVSLCNMSPNMLGEGVKIRKTFPT
jgi:hypothetical protein